MWFRLVPRKYRDRTYQYLQLVESYRDGKRTLQRVLHSFGNVAHLSDRQRETLLRSLRRALGLDAEGPDPDELIALDTRHYADLLVLRTLWEDLNLPRTLADLTKGREIQFDLDLLAFLMTAHRLIGPGSKLALTRWLPQAFLQGYDLEAIQVQHCYRALDLIAPARMDIEEALFLRLSNLFDRELSLVFYDLTSTYFEGEGPPDATYGYSRDRRPDQQQLVLALAVDRRGLPITHLVFPGNRVDQQTLQDAVGHLRERFSIERAIFVADGGLMSQANIEHLTESHYQHLIALPKTRALARELAAGIEWHPDDTVAMNVMARQIHRNGLTYLVCFNPERAEQESQILKRRLDQTTERLTALRERVDEGRITEHGAISQALGAILAVSRTRRYFSVDSDRDGHLEFALREDVLQQARQLEGYYFLQTDTPDLDASAMLGAYKTLQQVEHAFRELKDTIELRPIYHYDHDRVRGHIFICLLAYLLERVLELRLEEAGQPQTARRALETLAPIRVVRNQLADRTLHCVIQRRPPGADAILDALNLSPLPVTLPS